jgi:hypothetical protein
MDGLCGEVLPDAAMTESSWEQGFSSSESGAAD